MSAAARPTLGGDHGKVRRDHPDTAHHAAATVKAGTLRYEVLELICFRRGGSGRGCTDEELARTLGRSENSVRPRRVELVDAGFVRDSEVRRDSRWARPMIVWEVTDAGVAAIQQAAVPS